MQARETVDGTLQLTLGFKREILLANIYGVDLDAQAVEVAQLSLYLKLLEEETTATAQQTFADFRTQLLPSLSNNIVHGNSLIDFDIMDGMLFDAKDLRKLNPLNFESTFPEIFRKGGFDAIVGNPPYGMISDETNKNYLERNFVTTEGRLDNYEVFIEKAAHLLNENALLGYIIPSPILSNLYTKKLRNFILNENSLIEITNFNMDVFDDPTVHTCIIILNKNKENQEKIKIRNKVSTIEELQNAYDFEIDKNNFGNNKNSTFDIFINPQTHNLFEKLNKNALKLGEICFIRQCIKTGNNKEYVSISMTELEEPWKKSLRGKSIGRYSTVEKDVYLKYGNWLARNWKNKTFYETPKIAIRETGSRLTATLDLENRYFLSSLYAIYPKAKDESLNLSYILALLNSNLAMFVLKIIALNLTEGAFTKFRTNQLARLPIRTIDFENRQDKERHDKLVGLVEQMLDAKLKLSGANTDKDKQFYERFCSSLDSQIDNLVYKLYELTDEEIAIVEGKD
jgi:hypothetical protein